METISIRNLRGTSLREKARRGKILAITNRGALIGVVVPVAPAWLEHLIDYNLSHVEQSIAEAEHAIAGGGPVVTLGEVVGQLQGMLNPVHTSAGQDAPAAPTVRIGDLTAKLIERAGAAGHSVAVTHDRELIAIVIPVTRNLVEFLLEQNMSRVLYNVGLAEKEIATDRPLALLGSLAAEGTGPGAPGPFVRRGTAPEPR
jgi:antitoxin (DNA-binding transcriptional repressor) of toxin-antitoxin stability system